MDRASIQANAERVERLGWIAEAQERDLREIMEDALQAYARARPESLSIPEFMRQVNGSIKENGLPESCSHTNGTRFK